MKLCNSCCSRSTRQWDRSAKSPSENVAWGGRARRAPLSSVSSLPPGGIERTDANAHRNLEEGLYFAVRTDAIGRPFIDYHTAQTPRARRGRIFGTRRAELKSGDLNTVLSWREWRTDACFTVVLWPRPESAVDLNEIAGALQRPHYTLYLGRKSAPLGLPLAPTVVEADTFLGALAKRQRTDEEETILGLIRGDTRPTVAFDADAPGAPLERRLERRRDTVVNRERWQFGDRLEGIVDDG